EMHKEWVRKNCTPGAAYNTGLTNGLTRGQMPERDYASSCPTNNEALNSAYLKGFSEGMKSRPQEININKNVTVNSDK
ncbi:MAG TPA: hypothetical protein VLH77_00985, partial [Gammaproteobacteria bacterium]|nr:hypothetical protein [Gammaproteobacteria bacterium]